MHQERRPPDRRPGRSDRVGTRDRGAATWEAILDQADALFAAHGFEAVSTNAIAAASNISVGTLYHYVTSKGEIAVALAERYEERLGRIITELTSTSSAPLDAQVRRCVKAVGEFAASNPAIAGLLEGRAPGASEARTRVRSMLVDCGRRFITARSTDLPDHQIEITANVCASVLIAVMHAAAEGSDHENGTAALIEEHAALLNAYLQDRFPSSSS